MLVRRAAYFGSVRIDEFEPLRIRDSAIRALLPRIKLVVDNQLNVQFPARRAARITVMTEGGVVYQRTRKGDPDMPLCNAELNEKFTELTLPVLGAEPTEKLLQNLWRLDWTDLSVCLTDAFIK